MTEAYKPILAVDAPLTKLDSLTYPLAGLIKYDGVRVIHDNGFYGRSLKLHKNPYLQKIFNKREYRGFDSEGLACEENHPLACSITSGAFARQKDDKKDPTKKVEVQAYCLVFDDFTASGGWLQRYEQAAARVKALLYNDPTHPIRMAPYWIIEDADELLEFERCCLEGGTFKGIEILGGYEGVILRKLDGEYKYGRTTEKEATYLRVKRFEEHEGVILRVEEGFTNNNVAKKNELGETERSTKKEGMVPNGEIAAYWVRRLNSDLEYKVAAGCLTSAEAKYYFANQHEFVGKISKHKVFAHGSKDKPRFPTHQSLRSPEDMS